MLCLRGTFIDEKPTDENVGRLRRSRSCDENALRSGDGVGESTWVPREKNELFGQQEDYVQWLSCTRDSLPCLEEFEAKRSPEDATTGSEESTSESGRLYRVSSKESVFSCSSSFSAEITCDCSHEQAPLEDDAFPPALPTASVKVSSQTYFEDQASTGDSTPTSSRGQRSSQRPEKSDKSPKPKKKRNRIQKILQLSEMFAQTKRSQATTGGANWAAERSSAELVSLGKRPSSSLKKHENNYHNPAFQAHASPFVPGQSSGHRMRRFCHHCGNSVQPCFKFCQCCGGYLLNEKGK